MSDSDYVYDSASASDEEDRNVEKRKKRVVKKKAAKKKKAPKRRKPRKAKATQPRGKVRLVSEINPGMNEKELESFTKKDLSNYLYDRDLDFVGRKTELVIRILDYFDGKLKRKTGEKRKKTNFSERCDALADMEQMSKRRKFN